MVFVGTTNTMQSNSYLVNFFVMNVESIFQTPKEFLKENFVLNVVQRMIKNAT